MALKRIGRMITKTLCFAVLVSACNTAQAVEPAKPPAKGDFHLFLLVGQSNMAGRGRITAEDKSPHPRVLMFNKEQKWVPAVAPLHFDKPAIVGVGLGRSFGMEIAKTSKKVTIGLIPCAVGGSPISSWGTGRISQIDQDSPLR